MARGPRAALRARLGEGGYKILFSLLSLAGIVLIAVGYGRYRAAGYIPVWDPPAFLRHLALLLVWVAFVIFPAAYLPGRIKATLKHPMLAAVKSGPSRIFSPTAISARCSCSAPFSPGPSPPALA